MAARGRGQRAGLSRQAVLAAARELAAERGLDGVSMRALAARLGVAPNALYSHVRDRGDLVDGLLDDVLDAVRAPEAGSGDPVAGLREVMVSTYEVLRAHPDLVPHYLARQGARGPNAQALGEVMTGLLGRAGVPGPAARDAVRVLVVHAIGLAAVGSGPDAQDGPALSPADLRATFLLGLGWLLDGITGAAVVGEPPGADRGGDHEPRHPSGPAPDPNRSGRGDEHPV